jgi:hypothetical protein
MNLQQMDKMDKIDIKLEFVRLVISDAYKEYRDADGVERLLSILEIYEHLLLRTKVKIATDLDDLSNMRKCVRDAGSLIQDMTLNEPTLMQGWYHGATPLNKAHALASLLARIMLECTDVCEQFEAKYPGLKSLLDSDGRYQALEPGAEQRA